jgi:hypothetical protein
MRTLVADAILLTHFAFVAFVVGGLLATWVGALLRARWVRNFWFRSAHLAAICFVAAEAIVGVVCPLTTWEDALRGQTSDMSFIARWIHRVLFYHFPDWVFTIAYLVFALIVIATYWLIPPAKRTTS